MDAKRPGELDQAIHVIPTLPVTEVITDSRTGRVLGKVLFDGRNRAIVSHDLRGHETPAWLLTRYERPSPATSSGVGGAPAGSGPTPPESGRPSVPLSTGRTSFIPGSTRTDGGETPSPNSGAPDTSIRAQSEAVKENPLQAASARDREKLAKLKAKLKAERPPEEE